MTRVRPPAGSHSAVDVASFVARLRATAFDSDRAATPAAPILVVSPQESEVEASDEASIEASDGGLHLRPSVQQLTRAIRELDPLLRWQLVGPAARGLVLLFVAVLIGGGWLAWRSVPRAAEVTIPVVPVSSLPGPSTSTQPNPQLVVQVVGPVVHPGIVRLPEGARVVDAIRAAGGMRKGVSPGSVNLARRVVDGEQLIVGPQAAAVVGGTSSSASPNGAPAGPIDLNTATLAELDTLPRVGPVMAQRIIDWRTSHGRFASVDELREITGIGSLTFAALSRLVRV